MSFAIEATSIRKRYGDIPVLDDITFKVKGNEFVTLFGPNGCGKSTILRILAGLDKAFEGDVIVFGGPPEHTQTGFVFQRVLDSVFPWMSCLKNVIFSQLMKGESAAAHREKGLYYLNLVGLAGWHDAYPYQLSGGMLQRLVIARALASEPKMFLMDEPFSALDHFGSQQMESLLLNLWQKHDCGTTVFVSHRLDQAILLADKLLLLSARPARIIQQFDISLGRPRTLSDVLTPEFQKIRSEILQTLIG
jgi:NitT/TauT family transport system ATP-binding protein